MSSAFASIREKLMLLDWEKEQVEIRNKIKLITGFIPHEVVYNKIIASMSKEKNKPYGYGP